MFLPDRPSLEQLRKQAKDLMREVRAGDTSALARIPQLSTVEYNYTPPIHFAVPPRSYTRH